MNIYNHKRRTSNHKNLSYMYNYIKQISHYKRGQSGKRESYTTT